MEEVEKTDSKNIKPREDLKALMDLPEVISWRAVLLASRGVFSKLESGLIKDGCSISRFQVLLLLYFEGPKPAIFFSKKLLLSRGNISTLLKRMIKDGLLIAGKRSTLSSRYEYKLTQQGRNEFERLFPEHIERIKTCVPKLEQTVIDRLRCMHHDGSFSKK